MADRYDDPISFYAQHLMFAAAWWDLFGAILDALGEPLGAPDLGDGWRAKGDEFEQLARQHDAPLRQDPTDPDV